DRTCPAITTAEASTTPTASDTFIGCGLCSGGMAGNALGGEAGAGRGMGGGAPYGFAGGGAGRPPYAPGGGVALDGPASITKAAGSFDGGRASPIIVGAYPAAGRIAPAANDAPLGVPDQPAGGSTGCTTWSSPPPGFTAALRSIATNAVNRD